MKTVKYPFYVALFVLSVLGCKKKTIAPVPPDSLTATAVSTTQVNLSWTDHSTNETGFKIERKTGSGSYAIVATVGTDVTSFSDVGLISSTAYTYRVYSYNQGGISMSYSNEASATTFSPVPVPPASLTATAISTTQVNLSWIDHSTNETGFKIERKTGPGSYAIVATVGTDITSFSDAGLISNTTYTYRVYSYNQGGSSASYSNEASATTFDPIAIGLKTGLIAYYPFSSNTNDESGNENNGIINGSNFIKDRFGHSDSALNFNSPNQYIRTKKVIQNVSNTFTIGFWVKPEVNDIVKNEGVTGYEGYGNQSVIHPSHGSNWGNSSLNAGVGINVGTNQIQIIEHTHLFISSPLVYATTLTGWHHVVLVYNSHIPYLYLDGQLVRTGLKSNIQDVRPSNGFDNMYTSSGFGRSFSPNGTPVGQFSGSLDEIYIWSRALTQLEIQYLATH